MRRGTAASGSCISAWACRSQSGELQIYAVGRILDSEFLLQARAAAERDTAPADHRVTADIVIRIDENDGRAAIASTNRRGQPGGAGPHDHHIGRSVALGRRSGRVLPRDTQSSGGRCCLLDKLPARRIDFRRPVFHETHAPSLRRSPEGAFVLTGARCAYSTNRRITRPDGSSPCPCRNDQRPVFHPSI